MTQEDQETFKEYAQRWRNIAAQVSPPLDEKELTRIFINTLSPFYYDMMVTSAPNDFAEIMCMGMRLEEGRLVKESVPADSLKKEDQEISTVKGWPQQQYPAYHPIAVVIPDANTIKNPGYQPQFPQYQQQPQQQAHQQFIPPNRAQKAPQYDRIPLKYEELLPVLLREHRVQTRPPPRVPKKLPARWRPDLFCAFHEGAQGHDVEHCFSLKIEVQNLIEANILSFEGSTLIVQANQWS